MAEVIEWGVFRLKGIFNRKTVKARQLDDGSWAVTERSTTDRLKRTDKVNISQADFEGQTCMSQSIVPKNEFEQYYAPVDAVAKKMV